MKFEITLLIFKELFAAITIGFSIVAIFLLARCLWPLSRQERILLLLTGAVIGNALIIASK